MEDRLHKFARLVEAESFTKAAAELHISQPALTTAIKKLERELRAELLVRGGHSFSLTDAGKITYEAAKELGVHIGNLKLRLGEAAGEKVALRIGMIDSIADLLFVHGNQLHELEQGARLSLTVNNSAQLIQLVAQDELDFALIAEPHRQPAGLDITPLAEEPLVLVCAAANHTKVLKNLENKRISHFLGYNQNSQTYRLVERHFRSHGITLQTTFYSTSPEIMLQLVLAGRGSAVLPYLLVKNDIVAGRLTHVAAADQPGLIGRRIVCLHRQKRTMPKSAGNLLKKTASQLMKLHSETQSL